MKRMLPTTLLALIAASPLAIPASAQELFSRERLTRQDARAASSSGVTEQGLRQLIERAGYGIDTVHENNVFEIEVTHEDWTFPVLVELSPDGSNMWCTVILNAFPGPPEDHAVRFSKLMAVNGKYGNVFFKMEPNSKMMMLVGSTSNRDMTASMLDELVKLLASIAADTDSLWKVSAEGGGDQRVSLIGDWRYNDSDRTMEFSFKDDDRFRAVFTDEGRKDTFLGTFELGEQNIKLTSDEGDELVLPIEQYSGKELTINVDGTRYVLVRR